MSSAPNPSNEEQRLNALDGLDILDTPAEERYDRITRLAARSLEVDFSEFNLIDESRQWSKSQFGTSDPVCDRENSFCAHTMLEDGITVITDATDHDVFCEKPPVNNPPYIRFYMSATVNSPEGPPIGTLCVFDDEPHQPDEREKKIMRDLGHLIEAELDYHLLSREQNRLIQSLEEAERRASTDSLTRAWRKEMIGEVLQREWDRAHREDLPLSVAMLDIDHFKEVNDTYGHQAGDEVLETIADRIRRSFRSYDALGRYGGEEFLIVFVETGAREAHMVCERIREAIDEQPFTTGDEEIDVSASLGMASVDELEGVSPETIVRAADERLYEAKESGRNKVVSGMKNPSDSKN